MDALFFISIVIAVVVLFDLLAVTHGEDSRPGFGISRAPDRIIPA